MFWACHPPRTVLAVAKAERIEADDPRRGWSLPTTVRGSTGGLEMMRSPDTIGAGIPACLQGRHLVPVTEVSMGQHVLTVVCLIVFTVIAAQAQAPNPREVATRGGPIQTAEVRRDDAGAENDARAHLEQ